MVHKLLGRGQADCWQPASPQADWSSPAALRYLSGRRGPPPTGRTDSLSWKTSWSMWQQCRAGRGVATPYGALWPRLLQDSGVAGFTVAKPRLISIMWVQTLRVWIRPSARSRPLWWVAARSWPSSRELLEPRCLPAAGRLDSRPREGGPASWMFEGSVGPIFCEEPGGAR